MACEFSYKNFFKRDFKMLKISGVWILDDEELPRGYLLYFLFVNIILNAIVNFCSTTYLFLKANSLQEFASLGLVIMTCIMGSVRVFFLFTSRFEVKELIASMSQDIFQPKNERELKIIHDGFKKFKQWRPFLIFWCAAAASSCNVLPWFTKWNDGLILLTWLPFVHPTKSPWFGIVYTQQFLAIFYICLIGTFTDILAAGLLSFIGVQCDLICQRVREICFENSCAKESLVACIEHHRIITRYVKTLEKAFGKIYFIQLFASLASLVMDFFLLSLADPRSFAFLYLVEYQVAVSIMLLVPCWFSSEMTKKGENIPHAAYSCGWITSNTSLTKNLIFFIKKTQKPLKFFAVDYFDISVEVFLKIVKTSFSYYAVLRSIKEKEK